MNSKAILIPQSLSWELKYCLTVLLCERILCRHVEVWFGLEKLTEYELFIHLSQSGLSSRLQLSFLSSNILATMFPCSSLLGKSHTTFNPDSWMLSSHRLLPWLQCDPFTGVLVTAALRSLGLQLHGDFGVTETERKKTECTRSAVYNMHSCISHVFPWFSEC